MKKLSFYSLLLLFVSAFMISSCGDDDVEGCTDPEAENYNAEATVSDGSCVYARDKFIGNYTGSFTCPGILGGIISQDMLEFTISEGLDANARDEVIVSLMNVGGLTIDLTANASGDMLTIDAEILGVPVQGFTGDVTGMGTATLDASGEMITAEIDMNVSVPVIQLDAAETCILVGTKQ